MKGDNTVNRGTLYTRGIKDQNTVCVCIKACMPAVRKSHDLLCQEQEEVPNELRMIFKTCQIGNQ